MITKGSYNSILLINPPGKVYVLPDGTPAHRKHCTPPLGLAYLAANLLQNGYEVQVMDILAEGYKNEIFKNQSIMYGLSTEDILARIEKAKKYLYLLPKDCYSLGRLGKYHYDNMDLIVKDCMQLIREI